jgi:glutathione S-transferase
MRRPARRIRAPAHVDYLVDGRFGVADVLVSTALSFAKRAKFPEPLPAVLDDVTRLLARPAY